MRFSVFYCQLSDDKCLLHSIWLSYFCRENVVGYQTKTVPAGFSLNTPTFVDVSNISGTSLQNFKLVGSAGDGTETIQVIEADGSCNTAYQWLTEENSGMPDGWYDENWAPVENTIVPGLGFLMNVGADVEAQFAGQVKVGNLQVTIPAGFTVVGNSLPVDISIQDMKLTTCLGDGTETIQVIELDGSCNTAYQWLTEENSGMPDGWYDENWSAVTLEVKAGTAFLFNVGSEAVLDIPAVVAL